MTFLLCPNINNGILLTKGIEIHFERQLVKSILCVDFKGLDDLDPKKTDLRKAFLLFTDS